jgi:hypothetical protein
MTLFRIISGLAIAALAGAIAYALRRRLKSWRAVRVFLHDQAMNSLRVLQDGKRAGAGRTLAALRRIVYLSATALFLLLAVTGFVPILFLGDHLSGMLLAIHVTVAPLFALSLSALAMLWAHRLRFDEGDWHCVVRLGKRQSQDRETLVRVGLKSGFWLVLLFSLPLILTVILELFPLFGTEGEAFLIRSHGYSALLLTLVALTQIFLTITYGQQSTGNFWKEERP